MKDYSEAEFLYDVRTADKKRDQGDIDDDMECQAQRHDMSVVFGKF